MYSTSRPSDGVIESESSAGHLHTSINLGITVAAFLAPIALYSVAALNPLDAYGKGLVLVAVLCAVLFSLVLVDTLAIHFAAFWTGLLIWQNAAIGVWLSTDISRFFFPVVELKTICIYVAAGWCLLKAKPQQRRFARQLAWPGVLLTGWVLLRTTRPTDPSALAYVRNFTSFIAVMVVGITAGSEISARAATRWFRDIAAVSLGVLAFGAVLEASVGTDGWRQIVGADALSPLLGSISERTTFLNHSVSRIGSLVIEPVNFSFLAMSLVIIAYYSRPKRSLGITAWVGIVLVLLAFGKGSMLLGGVTLYGLRSKRLQRKLTRKPLRTLVGVMASVVIVVLVYSVAIGGAGSTLRLLTDPTAASGDSTRFHVAALAASVLHMAVNPLGSGVGAGGILSNTFAASTDGSSVGSGGESGVGVLIHQLGIPGLVLFIVFVGRAIRIFGTSHHSALSQALLIAWFCGCLFQEQPLGPQAGGLYVLFAAIAGSVGVLGQYGPTNGSEARAQHAHGNDPSASSNAPPLSASVRT